MELMPAVLRPVSSVPPTTWMIDAARGVILRGTGWAELGRNAAVLWAMAAADPRGGSRRRVPQRPRLADAARRPAHGPRPAAGRPGPAARRSAGRLLRPATGKADAVIAGRYKLRELIGEGGMGEV